MLSKHKEHMKNVGPNRAASDGFRGCLAVFTRGVISGCAAVLSAHGSAALSQTSTVLSVLLQERLQECS